MAFTYARNTITGKVAKVPEHYIGHPVLGKNFVPAERGDKDYEPEMYSPKSADEFKSRPSRNRKADALEDPKEPEVPAIVIDIPAEEVNDGA
jgi:hypothetical protein